MESIEINNLKSLPSGENCNQAGYISTHESVLDYEIYGEDKVLEYIDYLNMTRVIEIMTEFFDVNTSVLAKENQLSSVALGSNLSVAFDKILENDPLTIIGSTVGFTKEVDLDLVKKIIPMNLRNIVATSYTNDAVAYLNKNSEINVIKISTPLQQLLKFGDGDVKSTFFGYLVQERNESKLTKSSFKVAGKVKPTQQQAEDAIFAWKVAKYSGSRVAVVAKDLSTKAIVSNHINLADAVECAMDLACEESKDAVLAVDGVIEQIEVLNAAIQARIGAIIEAGDIDNSLKFVKIADKYNMSIIHTGLRNNRY